MNVVPLEECPSPVMAGGAGTVGHLFVATSLDSWLTTEPDRFARDCQIDDTAYRRLDPEYYAWLRSRMALAKKAAAAARLDTAAFELLRLRFNAVHEWAVGRFGEDQLLGAVRCLQANVYGPPVADHDGSRSPLSSGKSPSDRITPEARALVDAISELALSLGWRRERLYDEGGNGVFDQRRGLVCYLKPADSIGEVTAQSIEIIQSAPSEVRHRFYNPDVDQPWIRRVRLS